MPKTIAILALLLPTVCWAGAPPRSPPPADEPEAHPAGKKVQLPGLVIDFRSRCLDLEATVCLDKGMLELIACTKQTKEHESILAIESRPMHVHAALLAIGAEPGNPAMMRAVDQQQARWLPIPPRGGPVDVFLVFEDSKGKMVEHPIGQFVARSDKPPDERFAPDDAAVQDTDTDEEVNATHLPKVGTKVTLRLRPQVKPDSKPGK